MIVIIWKLAAILVVGKSPSTKRSSVDEIQRRRKLEKMERGNIELDYDPTANLTLKHFDSVKANSKCLFAKQSRLWGSKSFCSTMTLEENMLASLPAMMKFVTLADSPDSRLDGFVVEVIGKCYCDNVESFAATLRRVLQVLSDRDPVGVHCMDMRSIDRPSWHFTFCTAPLFVTSFAPFYGPQHARHMYPDADTADSCFIMLQPETSFQRHDIGSDTPLTRFEDPQTMRDKIRCSFLNANQNYHIHPSNQYPVSTSYVASPELTVCEGPERRTREPVIIRFWDKEKYPNSDP